MALVLSWVFGSFMLAGAFTGLPLSVPPLPEDPKLAQIAPEECVWYASFAGMATPDANSENQTEQLFAEEENQVVVRQLKAQIVRSIERKSNGKDASVWIDDFPVVLNALLTRPIAAYLSKIEVSENHDVEIHAGLVANLGDDLPHFVQALKNLLALAFPDENTTSTVEAGGVTWQVPPMPPGAPRIQWGVKDQYLLVVLGEEDAATLVSRLENSTAVPSWRKAINDQIPVERRSSVGYLNVAKLVETFGPQLGDQRPVLTHLGLDDVVSVIGVTGMDHEACVSQTRIVMDGSPRGIWGVLPDRPLSGRDLSRIPAETSLAAAVRLDLEDIIDRGLDLAEWFQPAIRDEFKSRLRKIESNVGVNPRLDILKALDDVWLIYIPSGDLMTSWMGAAAAIKIKDRASLERALNVLAERAGQGLGEEDRPRPDIGEMPFRGLTIHYAKPRESGVPVRPAWCVTDDYLVLGLSPQSIKSHLLREETAKSLGDVSRIKELLDLEPAVITYADTQGLFRSVYPMLMLGAQMVSQELEDDGFNFDPSWLPSVESIAPHLIPSMTYWRRVENGYEAGANQTLPSGNLALTSPILLALFKR